MLKEIRPQPPHTVTIGDKTFKLKYTMNAKDYLERVYGSEQEAFTKCTGDNVKAKDMKHFIRAFMLINDAENLERMDNDDLKNLTPSLSEIGEMLDMDTMQAINVQLFNIAIESLTVEGENSLGESKQAQEILVNAIGALSKSCGKQNLEKALKIFGYLPQKIS